MCGILGVCANGQLASTPVDAGLEALAHRGPDARGVRRLTAPGAACVLGHTRLRVVDLSPEADQPLANEDATVWVAYNGELYNHAELRAWLQAAGHRFRCRSDTEVLVHLYEQVGGDPARMLGRLRGMFAFALFDRGRGRLLLARDRLGIKPLYWCDTPGGVGFASEVRALARAGLVGGAPDLAALRGYLAWGVVPGPRAVLAGVRELPPGSYLQWEKRRATLVRWWRPRPAVDPALAPDAPRLLRAALSDAVGRHLVADRPVAVFLSGGTDSAAVARLAARAGPVRALTVTWPDAGGDEGAAAEAIARRAGAAHDHVSVTGAQVADWLPDILRAMDQPTTDGVNTWLVCRAARQTGVVVALSGLGGDELFGGYPSFHQVPRVIRLRRLLGAVPAPLRAATARAASRRAPGSRAVRLLDARPGDAGAYLAVRGLFAPAELDGAWSPDDAFPVGVVPGAAGGHVGDRVGLLELGHYLPNQLLRDTDQMSMAHALEVRVPLLDDSVVRTALALPAGLRATPDKALLAAAAGLAHTRPKRPFALPLDAWLRGPLRDLARGALLSDALPLAHVVPAALRRQVWAGFEAGRVHWSRPWALAVLRLWPEANGMAW